MSASDPSPARPTLHTAIATIGAAGEPRYRGYDVGELVSMHTFPEVAYLLVYGDLPSQAEAAAWIDGITHHTMVHEQLRKVIESFPTDAPPHAIWSSAVAGLAALYPDAACGTVPADRRLQVVRLLGKGPTIAGDAYRHRHGFPVVLPDNTLTYAGDFLNLIFRRTEPRYRPHRDLERALDALLIAHAEPAPDVATHTVRALSAAHRNPYWAVAAGSTACDCSLAAGATREVLALVRDVASGRSISEIVAQAHTAGQPLPGFERRRESGPSSLARALKAALHEAIAASGPRPLVDAGLRLEALVESDASLGLVAGRDFFTALLFDALHLDDELIDVVLSIARTAGWLAHWEEVVVSGERPPLAEVVYTGPAARKVTVRPLAGPTTSDEGGTEPEMVSV